MKLRLFYFVISFVFVESSGAQFFISFGDSIRKAYSIPELAYAVVSSDSVLEMRACGEKRINSGLEAGLDDKFRIGSNTKAITGFIAAQLVKQHKISWD